jgi:HSP20 family protein
MTLIKKSSSPLMPRFFDDFFTRDLFDWGFDNSTTNTNIPAVNIIESNDHFNVEMAAPGMSKDDFHIELDGDLLTITSEKEMTDLKEGDRFTRREFSYQSFQRRFRLPKSVVDDSQIKASYKDGVLHIMIPKKEEAKALPPRKIEIS